MKCCRQVIRLPTISNWISTNSKKNTYLLRQAGRGINNEAGVMMKISLDVDIGGTFTDLFLSYDGKSVFTKTPTTGYNLSVGFIRAVKDAAAMLGISVKELLGSPGVGRYSTSI